MLWIRKRLSTECDLSTVSETGKQNMSIGVVKTIVTILAEALADRSFQNHANTSEDLGRFATQ